MSEFGPNLVRIQSGHLYAMLRVQGAVQRSQGALAVGLVSAVRSATVGVGASLLFCRCHSSYLLHVIEMSPACCTSLSSNSVASWDPTGLFMYVCTRN